MWGRCGTIVASMQLGRTPFLTDPSLSDRLSHSPPTASSVFLSFCFLALLYPCDIHHITVSVDSVQPECTWPGVRASECTTEQHLHRHQGGRTHKGTSTLQELRKVVQGTQSTANSKRLHTKVVHCCAHYIYTNARRLLKPDVDCVV